MVRGRGGATAGTKAAPARNVAPAKTAAEKKAAEAAEKAANEEKQVDEGEPQPTEENTGGDNTADGSENQQGGEENETKEGEDQDNQIEGEEKAGGKTDLRPLTEEDKQYIAEILETKVTLSDGTESKIFSYGPVKPGSGDQARPIVCHLCRVFDRGLGIKTHLQGKRHKESLRRRVNNIERFKQPFILFYSNDGDKPKQFQMYPGEDIEIVTPELESRLVDKVEWEYKQLDEAEAAKLINDPVYEYNKGRPVIGLDYMLKMKEPKTGGTKRFCVLCEELLLSDAYQHATGIKHQATYIIKHFPRLYEKVINGLKTRNPRAKENFVRDVFRKLYRKIEIKHGFKKMHLVDFADFKQFRSRYVNKIRKMPHYGEDTLEFTETEVNVLIRKCNNGMPFNDPDPPTLPNSARSGRRRRGGRSVAVRQNNDETGGGVQDWGPYKTVKDKEIEDLRAKYKKYDDNPQAHPSYQKEWSEFWHARCDELKKENINPDTYNFDQEWLPHFEKRLRKMYLKEVTERKRSLRMEYGLPLSRRTPEPFSQQSNTGTDAPQNVPRAGANAANVGGNTNRGNKPPSLFASQPNAGSARGFGGPGQGGSRGDGQRAGNRNTQTIRPLMQQKPDDQPARKRLRREPVTIISVLSLLTALEDQLGSLGPKSVQLLSKAVLWEKNNQIKQLLTDNEYYILFATAKEKLKGQIIANVIDRSKIEAANNAIDDLSFIINVMDKEARNKQDNTANNPNTGNRSNNYGGGRNVPAATMGSVNFGIDSFKGGNNAGNFGSGGGGGGGGMTSSGNFRSDNDNFRGSAGNFQNDAGNYRGDGGNYRNDGGNYRNDGGNNYRQDNSNFREDTGNFRSDSGNFRNDGGGSYRNEAGNFRNDGSNYRNEGSNFRNDSGNFGGNSRSIDDGGSNYRGGFNNDVNRSANFESGNYRGSNEGGNYRGMNEGGGNFSSTSNSMGTSNYRSNDNIGNARSGNFNDNVGTGNFRSNNMGSGSNLGGSSSNTGSNFRGSSNTAGGNYASGGGGSFGASGNSSSLSLTRNFTSDSADYRSGGGGGGSFDNSKFSSSYGGTGGGNSSNASAQRGSWMGGSGNVYSDISKTNTNANTPAFSSGMGYGQSSSMSSFNNRNASSNFNTGNSGGNYRRFN